MRVTLVTMPSEMEMQRVLEERMTELLEYASQSKVAEALGVTRTAVWRWAHGQAVTPGAVRRVQTLLRPDLPEIEETPPPEWAEGLATRVADSVVERIAMRLGADESRLLGQLEDRLRLLGLPLDEEPPEESEVLQDGEDTAPQREQSPHETG